MKYTSAPGRVRCEVCLAQNAEASERKIRNESSEQSEERKRKHREYLKRIRKERKERGVCIFCEKLWQKEVQYTALNIKLKIRGQTKRIAIFPERKENITENVIFAEKLP